MTISEHNVSYNLTKNSLWQDFCPTDNLDHTVGGYRIQRTLSMEFDFSFSFVPHILSNVLVSKMSKKNEDRACYINLKNFFPTMTRLFSTSVYDYKNSFATFFAMFKNIADIFTLDSQSRILSVLTNQMPDWFWDEKDCVFQRPNRDAGRFSVVLFKGHLGRGNIFDNY